MTTDTILVSKDAFKESLTEQAEVNKLLNLVYSRLSEEVKRLKDIVEHRSFALELMGNDEAFRLEDPEPGVPRVVVHAPCFPSCYNKTGMDTPSMFGWIVKKDANPDTATIDDIRPAICCMGCGSVRSLGVMDPSGGMLNKMPEVEMTEEEKAERMNEI